MSTNERPGVYTSYEVSGSIYGGRQGCAVGLAATAEGGEAGKTVQLGGYAQAQEIFGGGNAYLQLEDEKDILNCGIEIKVTLPGKTVKTISLLSGGEKAFVAIALYFAILKVRPTPFCILDEIEAALDDVNVDKYINYMRTLCNKTQFIVITHRRGTMEGADILYGVAMQETGVSKLLTINVSEIEEKIKLNEV